MGGFLLLFYCSLGLATVFIFILFLSSKGGSGWNKWKKSIYDDDDDDDDYNGYA